MRGEDVRPKRGDGVGDVALIFVYRGKFGSLLAMNQFASYILKLELFDAEVDIFLIGAGEPIRWGESAKCRR
ncbi:MAG: hypothetical protein C4324_11470, partial [Blastocatellia bacterium]